MNQKDEDLKQQLPVIQKEGKIVAKNASTLPSDDVITDVLIKRLIREAIKMLKMSYTPYSKFKVGAALLSKSNQIYTGCNIENASYSPTNCAERTAFFKAVSEGEHDFTAIAIVGGKDGVISDYCPPCGVCRQVMMEFCDPKKFVVILARNENDYWVYSLNDLLPLGFSGKQMNDEI